MLVPDYRIAIDADENMVEMMKYCNSNPLRRARLSILE